MLQRTPKLDVGEEEREKRIVPTNDLKFRDIGGSGNLRGDRPGAVLRASLLRHSRGPNMEGGA